jgi:hypothetical protein
VRHLYRAAAHFPEFATRMKKSIKYKETVQACYDQTGTIYTLKVVHP